MNITVTFQDGKWLVQPDPAIVTVGEKVAWLVRWPRSTTNVVRWAIYFTPFRYRHALVATTRNSHLGTILARNHSLEQGLKKEGANLDDMTDHYGIIGPVTPTDPGEYKYGINAADAETEKEIGDDDPKLIVRAH